MLENLKIKYLAASVIKIMALKTWLIRCVFILLDFNIYKFI